MNFRIWYVLELALTNILERISKGILRRIRVAALFSNTKTCQQLVTAVAMEVLEGMENRQGVFAYELNPSLFLELQRERFAVLPSSLPTGQAYLW